MMKIKIYTISILMFLTSCYPTLYTGNYGQINQTNVSLENANYEILGSYTGVSTVRSIHEFNYIGMIAEAREDLWKNARLDGIKQEGSKVLFNVTVEIIKNGFRRSAIISAEILEFKKTISKQEATQKVKSNGYDNNTNRKTSKVTQKEKNKKNIEAIKQTTKKIGDGISDITKKILKPKQNEVPVTTKESVKEKVRCSKCKETGRTIELCHKDDCEKGHVINKCSDCNGNFKDHKTTCSKCSGDGCEYCDYDGEACNACDKGLKNEIHTICNGSGTIKSSCSDCNGKGFLIK